MKGQAVNIDWTVGLGIFMTALLSGVIIIVGTNFGPDVGSERQEASLIQDSLEDETYLEGRQTPLVSRTPSRFEDIPVDQEYIFPDKAYAGSGSMDIPATVNITGNRLVTVIDRENTSYSMNYFFSNRTNLSFSGENDLETRDWMNNTQISVKPGGQGIDSIKINDKEVLNPEADLSGSEFGVNQGELKASSLDGDLKIYNGSREMILEDPGTVTFDLVNFTKLYWYNGNQTIDTMNLDSNPKTGETAGFSVAEDYGITFLGDLDANVSRPDDETVRAEVTASRIRIFLHDSGYETGWQRIEAFDKGWLTLGAEKQLEGATTEGIEDLDSTSQSELETRLNIDDHRYNITFGSMERGFIIPLEDVVVSDLPSVKLGRYGNYSIIENRVAVWR